MLMRLLKKRPMRPPAKKKILKKNNADISI
jgi:hypothetical protein